MELRNIGDLNNSFIPHKVVSLTHGKKSESLLKIAC